MRRALFALFALGAGACHARTHPPPPEAKVRPARTSPPGGPRPASSGVPRLGHIWLVILENAGFDEVVGAAAAPFLNRELIGRGALLTRYHAVAHPSLPNYLALVGGDTFGIRSDGEAADPAYQVGPTRECLGDQLSKAGLPWHAFAEGMARPCQPNSARRYAVRHNPFAYFQSLASPPRCRVHDLPFEAFAATLAEGEDRFTLLVPDVCDDGHDACGGDPIAHIDAWLARTVPGIQASRAYQDGGVLFVTWDEDDGQSQDNRVPLIVLSPLLRGAGLRSDAPRTHYSLLATIEDGLGLPRLANAIAAKPLSDLWR